MFKKKITITNNSLEVFHKSITYIELQGSKIIINSISLALIVITISGKEMEFLFYNRITPYDIKISTKSIHFG